MSRSQAIQIRPKLILASGSPRRRELLIKAGYVFTVVPPRDRAECGVCSEETPPELVARLAWQKADDVASRIAAGEVDAVESAVIVACDTVALCAGHILGKPIDREHARWMLRLLSGRTHHVYSGLCLWPPGGARQHVNVAVTTLRMDPLSDPAIDDYLATDQWQGKAGAFGYQDRVDWLHIVEGSESNVVGLPLELLAEMLSQL